MAGHVIHALKAPPFLSLSASERHHLHEVESVLRVVNTLPT